MHGSPVLWLAVLGTNPDGRDPVLGLARVGSIPTTRAPVTRPSRSDRPRTEPEPRSGTLQPASDLQKRADLRGKRMGKEQRRQAKLQIGTEGKK